LLPTTAPRHVAKFFGIDYSRLEEHPSPAHKRIAPSPIGSGWAITDALGLVALISPSLVGSLVKFAELCGLHWPNAPLFLLVGHWLTAAGTLIWLGVLVIGRRPRWWTRVAAVTLGALTVFVSTPYAGVLHHRFMGDLLTACSLAWLTLEVCRRHGITRQKLGFAPEGAAAQRGQAWTVAGATIGICFLAGGLTQLATMMLSPWDWAPVLRTSQAAALGLDNPVALLPGVLLAAGVIEDLIVIVAVTALFTTARRPAWQIYSAVAILDICLHLYMGLPGLLLGANGIGRAWLYRRYGRLTPMLVSHLALDLFGLLLAKQSLLVKVGAAAAVIAASDRIERWHKGTHHHSKPTSGDLAPAAPNPNP
jgi:hypothetical protein